MSFFNRTSNVIGSSDANLVYYNISMSNTDTLGVNPPPPVRFNETRSTPFLNTPSQYFGTLSRFGLDTATLPVFRPQIETQQTNPNATVYYITLVYTDPSNNTTEIQKQVMFKPQNSYASVPPSPFNGQDLLNEYYLLESYDWFIQLLNDTFVSCLTDASASVLPSQNVPFMVLNNDTKLTTLYCDISGYDTNKPNHIKIFFNAPLYTLFCSFKALNQGYNNQVVYDGKNYNIIVSDNKFNVDISSSLGYTTISTTQEYSTLPLWTPIESIVFTTSLLPIVNELTGVPVIFNSNSASNSSNANISATITDFEVLLTTGTEFKPTIQYTPAGEYRLFDMTGNSPLYSIDVAIYWKDCYGNLIPFKLAPNCSCSIKMLFRKKSYNNPELV